MSIEYPFPQQKQDEDRAEQSQGRFVEQKQSEIVIPDGKMESSPPSLGSVEITLQDNHETYSERLELLISGNANRERDLYAQDSEGNESPLIQLQVTFNDATGHHEAVYTQANPELVRLLGQDPEFQEMLDRYFDWSMEGLEAYLTRYDLEGNGHSVRQHTFELNGRLRSFELVHQIRQGDCVIANYLNTESIERNGHVGFTVSEARELALLNRQMDSEKTTDIVAPDSPLNYEDVIRLFSGIYGVEPDLHRDMLTVEGMGFSFDQLRTQAYEIILYLEKYPSGLVSTGMGYHSRTIKKLATDRA